ncbi:TIGR03619 family F420-dependent LLM class oxidoreductase [Mycolicibacterium vinylchloridicum]|uniref:TIGR03619 family F420-dependent LLM class oxidoreductase n=1 Tax=Mycolicibacterium vinylchloridicum TaxID=2736928 RepID=UPI0015CBBBD0|nr:TIGR03619 family F420-dependent LLM class oxidoreductase [Mycolicibacterium vinylchloridicum]
MTLHYSFELPTTKVGAAAEFITAAAIAEIATAAESCGYDAVHVTDHPAPDSKWLDHGGHHALDPFVALSFAAAATSTIKLLTNIYVAAYRNPFLGAKMIQSLDMLSGRRLILGTGAGYLRPEYRALGVDFDSRGALLDEALDVLAKIYTGEDVAYDGAHFSARGVRFRPLPPGGSPPPVWIGGNSKIAVRRAVSRHEGWAPFNTVGYEAASRTAGIASVDELKSAIDWARAYGTSIGRTQPLDICFSASVMLDGKSTDEQQAVLAGLEGAGVTWVIVSAVGDDRHEVIANLRNFADRFVTSAAR